MSSTMLVSLWMAVFDPSVTDVVVACSGNGHRLAASQALLARLGHSACRDLEVRKEIRHLAIVRQRRAKS